MCGRIITQFAGRAADGNGVGRGGEYRTLSREKVRGMEIYKFYVVGANFIVAQKHRNRSK